MQTLNPHRGNTAQLLLCTFCSAEQRTTSNYCQFFSCFTGVVLDLDNVDIEM